MAFDMGFDFRQTLGYVTDPAPFGVAELGSLFPTLYTNGAGQSINAGWTDNTHVNPQDRANTNDPRIAGTTYVSNTFTRTFRIDLSSGSAPGPGMYILDIAFGDAGTSETQDWIVKDDTTAIITVSNVVTNTGQFVDATGALVT